MALVHSLDISLDGTPYDDRLDLVDSVVQSGYSMGYHVVGQNTIVNEVIHAKVEIDYGSILG